MDKRSRALFIYGLILGTVIFIAVYGAGVLNVTHDGWIFKSDIDLRQHYLGWMAYRNTPWGFPLGMTDRLSYPHAMSIVYTDSIPLLALLFKLLSPILPETFQYFGFYGLLCFALTGAFGARLLGRLTKRSEIAVLMSIPLIISFPMLQRTFYHTSLASQWLILWAFDLWFSGELVKKSVKCWIMMGILCAGIHLYFLPFVACIFCGAYLEEALKKKNGIWKCILGLMLMSVTSAALLWFFGAFAVAGSGEYWIGDFTMNLSSLINSMGKSILLPGMPLYGEMQFEGAVYPGIGILGLCLLVCVLLAVMLVLKKIEPAGTLSFKRHPRRMALAVVAVIFLTAAVLPTVAFGDTLIFRVPYPQWLSKLLGIFRSNGRFAWGALYILIFSLVRFLDFLSGSMKYPMAIVPALCCAALTVADFMPWMAERHGKYLETPEHYVTVWDEISLPEGYDGFITFEKDNTFNMGTACYAMKHGMTLNYFYFARDINDSIEETLSGYRMALSEGRPDPGYVYVLDKETWEELKNVPGLHFYKTRKCAFAVAGAIDGMEELDDAAEAEIHWRSDQ